jgi:hypothetical protein
VTGDLCASSLVFIYRNGLSYVKLVSQLVLDVFTDAVSGCQCTASSDRVLSE